MLSSTRRTLADAAQFEDDRRLGIVVTPPDPDQYARAFTSCPLGPRCPYPVHCCDQCSRHSPIKHDCG